VDLFVVGLPFNKDGKEQEMTFIAKSFGRKLTNRYKLEKFASKRLSNKSHFLFFAIFIKG
jgi:putative Holliday junction resolvase